MVVAIAMPSATLFIDATPERPLLSILFYLNWQIIADLIITMGIHGSARCLEENSVSIIDADIDFMEAMFRLARLLDKPEQADILAPLVLTELHYLLLSGQHGKILSAWYLCGASNKKILAAVSWLKNILIFKYVPSLPLK